jgi:hypothetical protein
LSGRKKSRVSTGKEIAMSQFVYLFRSNETETRTRMSSPEMAQKSMQAWMAWIARLDAAGHLADRGHALEWAGKVVRKGQLVTDGPLVEAKDLVLGFTVVEAKDLAEAAALAEGCPILAGEGSVEVRPLRVLK